MDNVISMGDKKSDYEKIVSKLDDKIPTDVISKRDAGQGRKLDYLEGWYVIARLNEILGQGNWSYNTEEMKLVHSGEVDGKFVAHYVAKVTLAVNMDGFVAQFTDYGYGDGMDRNSPGKPHELAVKEAVTDGIKRCAKNLGHSMGLALYDKSRENVGDGETTKVKSKSGAGNPKGVEGNKPTSIQSVSGPANNAAPSTGETERTLTTPTTRDEINVLITSTSRAIAASGKSDVTKIKAYMVSKYGTDKKEALTDPQAAELLAYLQALIN
jgi:DNA recombination protein Rad52